MTGEIVEALRNGMFRIKLDNGHETLGYTAGKMRRFRIRMNPGDRVRIELSAYDLDRGRIVYRLRPGDDRLERGERLSVHARGRVVRLLGTIVARPEPVDDAAAIEVICRQLDADPVAGIHADAEPAHLAGRISECLVAVVELDPEHAVPQRFDDLAGHLDLVFLLCDECLLSSVLSGG